MCEINILFLDYDGVVNTPLWDENGTNLSFGFPENGKVILSGISTDYFYDIWVFQQDFELKEVVLLEGETCDVRYATAEEILKMQQKGIFVPYEYLAELFQKIGLIRE